MHVFSLYVYAHGQTLANKDETWAEFSSLDVAMLVYAMNFHSLYKQPNLKLKTQPGQLLDHLLLAPR